MRRREMEDNDATAAVIGLTLLSVRDSSARAGQSNSGTTAETPSIVAGVLKSQYSTTGDATRPAQLLE